MSAKPLALQRLSNVELEHISGWGQLAAQEKKTVQAETKQLFDAVHEAGKSRLRIGQHLSRIRDVLEPKRGMWERYLKSLNISRATAYRMIDDYNAARTVLPSPIMQVAMMRGSQRLNPALIKALPPPKTGDFVTINAYLDKVDKRARDKRTKEAVNDPEVLKKITINGVRLNYEKLPKNPKLRQEWKRSVSSMILSLGGNSEDGAGKITLTPSPIPDGYFVPVGRPPLPRKEVQRVAE